MNTGKRDAVTHYKIDEWDRKAIKQSMNQALDYLKDSEKTKVFKTIFDVKFANNGMLFSYGRVMVVYRDTALKTRTDPIMIADLREFEKKVRAEHSRLTLIRNKMGILDPKVFTYEWTVMHGPDIPKTPFGLKTAYMNNLSIPSSNSSGSSFNSDASMPNMSIRAHSTAITSPGKKSPGLEETRDKNTPPNKQAPIEKASSLKNFTIQPSEQLIRTSKKPKPYQADRKDLIIPAKGAHVVLPEKPKDKNNDTKWRPKDNKKDDSTDSCDSEPMEGPKGIPGLHTKAKLRRPSDLDGSYLDEDSIKQLKTLQETLEKGKEWTEVISPRKLTQTTSEHSTLTEKEKAILERKKKQALQKIKDKECGSKYYFTQRSQLNIMSTKGFLKPNDHSSKSTSELREDTSMESQKSDSLMEVDTAILTCDLQRESPNDYQMVSPDALELLEVAISTGPPTRSPFKDAKVEPVPVVSYCQMASRYRPYQTRRRSDGDTPGVNKKLRPVALNYINMTTVTPTDVTERLTHSDQELPRQQGLTASTPTHVLAESKLILRDFIHERNAPLRAQSTLRSSDEEMPQNKLSLTSTSPVNTKSTTAENTHNEQSANPKVEQNKQLGAISKSKPFNLAAPKLVLKEPRITEPETVPLTVEFTLPPAELGQLKQIPTLVAVEIDQKPTKPVEPTMIASSDTTSQISSPANQDQKEASPEGNLRRKRLTKTKKSPCKTTGQLPARKTKAKPTSKTTIDVEVPKRVTRRQSAQQELPIEHIMLQGKTAVPLSRRKILPLVTTTTSTDQGTTSTINDTSSDNEVTWDNKTIKPKLVLSVENIPEEINVNTKSQTPNKSDQDSTVNEPNSEKSKLVNTNPEIKVHEEPELVDGNNPPPTIQLPSELTTETKDESDRMDVTRTIEHVLVEEANNITLPQIDSDGIQSDIVLISSDNNEETSIRNPPVTNTTPDTEDKSEENPLDLTGTPQYFTTPKTSVKLGCRLNEIIDYSQLTTLEEETSSMLLNSDVVVQTDQPKAIAVSLAQQSTKSEEILQGALGVDPDTETNKSDQIITQSQVETQIDRNNGSTYQKVMDTFKNMWTNITVAPVDQNTNTENCIPSNNITSNVTIKTSPMLIVVASDKGDQRVINQSNSNYSEDENPPKETTITTNSSEPETEFETNTYNKTQTPKTNKLDNTEMLNLHLSENKSSQTDEDLEPSLTDFITKSVGKYRGVLKRRVSITQYHSSSSSESTTLEDQEELANLEDLYGKSADSVESKDIDQRFHLHKLANTGQEVICVMKDSERPQSSLEDAERRKRMQTMSQDQIDAFTRKDDGQQVPLESATPIGTTLPTDTLNLLFKNAGMGPSTDTSRATARLVIPVSVKTGATNKIPKPIHTVPIPKNTQPLLAPIAQGNREQIITLNDDRREEDSVMNPLINQIRQGNNSPNTQANITENYLQLSRSEAQKAAQAEINNFRTLIKGEVAADQTKEFSNILLAQQKSEQSLTDRIKALETKNSKLLNSFSTQLSDIQRTFAEEARETTRLRNQDATEARRFREESARTREAEDAHQRRLITESNERRRAAEERQERSDTARQDTIRVMHQDNEATRDRLTESNNQMQTFMQEMLRRTDPTLMAAARAPPQIGRDPVVAQPITPVRQAPSVPQHGAQVHRNNTSPVDTQTSARAQPTRSVRNPFTDSDDSTRRGNGPNRDHRDHVADTRPPPYTRQDSNASGQQWNQSGPNTASYQSQQIPSTHRPTYQQEFARATMGNQNFPNQRQQQSHDRQQQSQDRRQHRYSTDEEIRIMLERQRYYQRYNLTGRPLDNPNTQNNQAAQDNSQRQAASSQPPNGPDSDPNRRNSDRRDSDQRHPNPNRNGGGGYPNHPNDGNPGGPGGNLPGNGGGGYPNYPNNGNPGGNPGDPGGNPPGGGGGGYPDHQGGGRGPPRNDDRQPHHRRQRRGGPPGGGSPYRSSSGSSSDNRRRRARRHNHRQAAAQPVQDRPRQRRLPELKAFLFKGDIEEYPLWRSRFREAIEAHELSNREKVHFLLDCLSGEPKESILSLVTSDNINDETLTRALAIIERRFGGQDRLRTIKTAKLSNLTMLKSLSYEHVKEFRVNLVSLADYCRTHDPIALTQIGHAYATSAKKVMGPNPMTIYLTWKADKRQPDNLESIETWLQELVAFAEEVDILHGTLLKTSAKTTTKETTVIKKTAVATAKVNLAQENEEEQEAGFQQDQQEFMYHANVQTQVPMVTSSTHQNDQIATVAAELGKQLINYFATTGMNSQKPADNTKTTVPEQIKTEQSPQASAQQFRGNSPNRTNNTQQFRGNSPNRNNNGQQFRGNSPNRGRTSSPGRYFQNSNSPNRNQWNNNSGNNLPQGTVNQNQPSFEQRQQYQPRTQSPQPQARPESSPTSTTPQTALKWNYLPGECTFCGAIREHKPADCKTFLSLPKQQKWDMVASKRLCYHCLRFGHNVAQCNVEKGKLCGMNGCQRVHHPVLHLCDPFTAGQILMQLEEVYDFPTFYSIFDGDEKTNYASTEEIFNSTGDTPTAIQTINCVLTVGKNKVPITAILDTGSNNTNIDLAFAKRMGMKLEGPPQTRFVRYLDRLTKIESYMVSFQITSADGHTTQTMYAWTIEGFADCKPGTDWTTEKLKFTHLADLPILKPADPAIPILLIGSNNALLFTQLDRRFGKQGEPVGFLTPLGWSIFGRNGGYLRKNKHPISAQSYKVEDKRLDDLYDLVKHQNDLELLGLNEKEPPFSKGYHGGPKPFKLWSELEKQADAKMIINRVEGETPHYEARMPWKEEPSGKMEGNYRSIAMRQGKVWKALPKFGTDAEEYSACLQAFIDKGYVEDVPKDEITQGWYVPHRPVVNREKVTTPIRPVFDCGATYRGMSANSNTEPGPNRLNDIFHVLLRWRRYEYAFTGDISEMFLRVRLAPQDRKYFRFMIGDRHVQWTRVPFGGNACPNISQKVLETLERDYGKDYPAAIDVIINSFYMDDGIDSRPTEEEVMTSVTDLMGILQKADMKIGKFYSNSKKVIESLPLDKRAKEASMSEYDKDTTYEASKVLGMHWSAEGDFITFKSKYSSLEEWLLKLGLTRKEDWTKRAILRAVASTYDPLGLINPVIVWGRVIIQDLWAIDGLDWDDKIPVPIQDRWTEWLTQLFALRDIKIPRWIKLTYKNLDDAELHTFCDASEAVYAASVYLRVNSKGGKVSTILVAGKARVSPHKNETISRLELVACVIGTRLVTACNLVFNINPKNVFFWTDSRNALCWINAHPKACKVYVQNRVGEIQRVTEKDQWMHVPTGDNPADAPTRPITVEELTNHPNWWYGPPFLHKKNPVYPKFNVSGPKPNKEFEQEMKPDVILHNLQIDMDPEIGVLNWEMISVGNIYDGLNKMLKKIILCIIIADYWTARFHAEQPRDRGHRLMIKTAQSEMFEHEIDKLRTGVKYVSKTFAKYVPFFDQHGIIRANTRLINIQDVALSMKCPIILQGTHRYTLLHLTQMHLALQHPVGETLMRGKIAERYIVIGLKGLLKKIRNNCIQCQRMHAQPMRQQMAPLPSWRFEKPYRVFSKVGIDFAGPFEVITAPAGLKQNRYVLLFTCLQVRAVHFEVCSNQTTQSVLNAMSRFCDIRGVPDVVFCDNQSSFHAAEKELKRWLNGIDWVEVREFKLFMAPTIRWQYNTPRAPHKGGVYEIMVKAMKRAFSILSKGKKRMTDEVLRTTLSRAATLVNSRPLSHYVPEDGSETEILTPNTFLVGRTHCNLTTGHPSEEEQPDKVWCQVNALVDELWSRFHKEILPELQPRDKWYRLCGSLEIDDMVLIIDPKTPRGLWRMGKVVSLKSSEDDITRTVSVFSGGRTLDYSITHLIKLFTPGRENDPPTGDAISTVNALEKIAINIPDGIQEHPRKPIPQFEIHKKNVERRIIQMRADRLAAEPPVPDEADIVAEETTRYNLRSAARATRDQTVPLREDVINYALFRQSSREPIPIFEAYKAITEARINAAKEPAWSLKIVESKIQADREIREAEEVLKRATDAQDKLDAMCRLHEARRNPMRTKPQRLEPSVKQLKLEMDLERREHNIPSSRSFPDLGIATGIKLHQQNPTSSN